DPVATKLTELFRSLPKFLRRTITFDNGTEFSYHYRLHKLSMRTFFCDPHAPWQKGGIENAIGRMRRGLPRKTDLATLSNQRLLFDKGYQPRVIEPAASHGSHCRHHLSPLPRHHERHAIFRAGRQRDLHILFVQTDAKTGLEVALQHFLAVRLKNL